MERTHIAVVGATGLVGLEMRKLWDADPELKPLTLKLFASYARPDEGVLSLADSKGELANCQYILNATGDDVARSIKDTLKPGQVLIDNSSAFRLDPEVPLVVPEVNGSQVQSLPQVIANPNCTAILLCMVLNALKQWTMNRVIVSTYQAASGAGLPALEELQAQVKAAGQSKPMPEPRVFPYQLFSNVISHNTPIRSEGELGEGYNGEEWKVIQETRKILEIRHLPISATCMRVPVMRAHTESVTIDFKQEFKIEEVRKALSSAPGLKIVDDWAHNHFPMPLEAENQDLVLVGRIRKDVGLPKTLHLVLCGDQIRKGAATNALQILKLHMDLSSAGMVV
jgi:aspartate-semialdehyde dehydrogenase